MKLKYSNAAAVEPVRIYNGLWAKDGDTIDSADLGEFFTQKALKNPHFSIQTGEKRGNRRRSQAQGR